jgi:hypothetical protein
MAFVYHRTGANSWGEGVGLLSTDLDVDDYFGTSVSNSGEYVIVGAPYDDEGGTNAGAAYVFHRTGINDWDEGFKLMAPDAEAIDLFGSVSIDGDYAIVGAEGEDSKGSNAGAAYIFHRTGTNSWGEWAKLVAPDAGAGAQFGCSVSINGDYAIVGALYAKAEGATAGAAYVFHRTDTNSWDGGGKLFSSDIEFMDLFGGSVSISGDYAIVSAPGEDSSGDGAGAAYVFRRIGLNGWDAGTKLVAPDAGEADEFGSDVSISGDRVIVSAVLAPANESDAGAVYIFRRTGPTSWSTGAKLYASDAQADDQFGTSVSSSADFAVVGARFEDAGGTDAGAAYIYY